MRRGVWVLGLVALLGAVPVAALAQSGGSVSGLLVRVQGDLVLDADESADLVVVISGDAEVQGRAGAVVVIGGTARLTDARVGRLVVLRGTAELVGSARVSGDVWLLSADLRQSPSSEVGGSVRSAFGIPGWRFVVEEPLLAVGLLLVVLAAGWAAVALGVGTMRRSVATLTADLPGTLGAGLLLFVLGPAVALLLFFSVVGMPLSVVYLAVGLPLLTLAGFCVSSLWVGSRLLPTASARPLAAMLLGVVSLAAAGLIPFAGQIIVAAAALLGAGALVAGAGWAAAEEAVEVPGEGEG